MDKGLNSSYPSFMTAAACCKIGSLVTQLLQQSTETLASRYRSRFFDQIGHQNAYVSMGNKYFLIKSYHHQAHQNYEQSQQKVGRVLGNKVT